MNKRKYNIKECGRNESMKDTQKEMKTEIKERKKKKRGEIERLERYNQPTNKQTDETTNQPPNKMFTYLKAEASSVS